MTYTYRVRGPYSTAIAKIIMDSGHKLVDLSEQLAQRFSLPPRREEVPHATVKTSNDDPSTIVIVGLSKAVEELFNIIVSSVPYIGREINRYGPYTTVVAQAKGFKDNQCIAMFNDMMLMVQNYRHCIEGEPVIVHIVKPAVSSNRTAIAFPGISILKDTVVLLDDGMSKVFFSEHIKDPERRSTLSTLSNHILRMGYSIRWRSSAKSAELEKIAKDLEEALQVLQNLGIGKYSVGDVVIEGEAIAFIRLSRPSKEYLDIIRDRVMSTALGHHITRSCRNNGFVDIIDRMSSYLDKKSLYRALRYAIADNTIGKIFKVVHRKFTGEKIELNDLEIVNVVDTQLGKAIIGKRFIKTPGIYDGLGVPKERGDIAITLIPIDEWFIVHRYIGINGNDKGIYININTPPEICMENRTISYIDLHVDITYRDGKLNLIDYKEFEDILRKEIISKDFEEKVNEVIKYIENNIEVIIDVVKKIV
ncbi:MAG: DUF402 domain-containing protein [Ignisphaera sp.]|uniref:DUF402 domain-containing protein n=1 Tax=Ignisphaera aggregans TaxID=334771 RepID=A0A7J3MXZ6_9CREN